MHNRYKITFKTFRTYFICRIIFYFSLFKFTYKKTVENQVIKKFVWVLLLIFSVYPTIVDIAQEIVGDEYIGLSTIGAYGSQWGYTIVNFTLMYIIGAYIRVQKKIVGGNAKHNVFKIFGGAILLVL